MEQPRRRLSAVWFADIVGYTPLSARDEPAALALVSALQRISREIIEEHEGRVVKFIGDAVLAEFSSTESAVRAAVAVQERFVRESAAQGQDSTLRIGVHLGEVTATQDGDLYGDGINTAARLQHEARPGQVIASEDVWRQLRQRPEFRFDSLGDVELKGITARVGVYDVLFGARAAITPLSTPGQGARASSTVAAAHAAASPVGSAPLAAAPAPTPVARSGNGVWIAAGIVLAAVIGVGGYAMFGPGGSDAGLAATSTPSAAPTEGISADSSAMAATSAGDSAALPAPTVAPSGSSSPGGTAPTGMATSTAASTAPAAGPKPSSPSAPSAAATTANATTPSTTTGNAPASNPGAAAPPAGAPGDGAMDALPLPPLPPNAGFGPPPPNAPPLAGAPIPPQAVQAAQRMAFRYLQVLNAPNPARALRAIYPSVTPLQINAVQQIKIQFGPGLAVRPGSLQATRAQGDTLNVRFTLLMSSPNRPEVMSQFEGKLLPTPQGLVWVDIRRVGGRGGQL